MRIFVVENHPDTLMYLKMFLENLGHSVTTATTLQDALAASPTEKCNVLISDLGLPDGTGWDLMEQAKFPQPVYAMAMSGFAAEGDIARSKAAGFRCHIAKPFRGEDLRRALDEAAGEMKALSSKRPPATRIPRKKRTSRMAVCLTPEQIADQLHQSTCQHLIATHLLLSVLRDQLPPDAAEVRQHIEKAVGMLDEASTELAVLMAELRASTSG